MIGPARPGQTGTSASGSSAQDIGPTIPAHLQKRLEDAEEEDDDDDGYAPALPPSMAGRTVQGPVLPSRAPQAEADSESDSDDDVGPAPPPAEGTSGLALSAAEEFRLREKRQAADEAEKVRLAGLKPKREDWMLVPPEAMDLLSSTDPTKLKARGFAQSTRKGGGAGEKASEEARSLWTETPQERAQRLDDEVMGKRKRVENAAKQETDAERAARRQREARDADMRAQVQAYNTATSRSESLVDAHASRKGKEAEERASKKSKSKHRKSSRSPSPPAPAFWDREKAMSVGGRLMEDGKRKDVIGSSGTNLSSKFGGGTFL